MAKIGEEQLVTCFLQVGGHGLAHDAGADKSDFSHEKFLLLLGLSIVPTLCVGMPLVTLCVTLRDAGRPGLHSHAERGNDQSISEC